jgi:AP-2 complex subunit alpha
LIINYGEHVEDKLRVPMFSYLEKFLQTHEPNIRYIGLDLMNNILKRGRQDDLKSFKVYVIESLRDSDISVRKRALENIYSMTDIENFKDIVEELLVILVITDSAIKEEFVVKIALIAEKYYGENLKWYVDTMIKMYLTAGDYASETIWHRTVLIITNHPEIHEYSAEKFFECVKSKWAYDIVIGLSSYMLGEIGVNICEKPHMSGYEQFAALHQHFTFSSVKTQSILLSTYMKLLNLYPETKEPILEVFTKYSTSFLLELQQRSCEFLKMPTINHDIMENV